MARPLIFVSCGATTAPLIGFLSPACAIVVPDARTAEALCRQGVEALGWGAFAEPARVARLQADADRMAREWRAQLEARGDELFVMGGRSRREAVLPALEEILRTRLAAQLAVLEFGRSLAQSGRLAAAVLHEDVTGPARAFLEGLRPFGVPTVHVPHGLYAEERVVGADVHGVAHTDVIAVAGAVQRDWFLARGIPPQRLVITGNPAWDHLCRQPRLSPAALGLEGGRVVTVATSWLAANCADHEGVARTHTRQIRACLEGVAALGRDDVRLVMKLHPSAPSGEEERLRRLAAEVGVHVDLMLRDRLKEVLATSDVLLTLPSTITVEAMVAGTPVVVTEFFYATDAVLSTPATAGAIAAALRRVLDGWGRSPEFTASRREFLRLYNGPSDGRAGERVAQLVVDLASRPHARAVPTLRHRVGSARALASAGDHAAALALLDGARPGEDDPPLADEFWTLRGEALSKLGRAAEAEACFRAAGGPRGLAGLGLLLLERGEHAAAEAHLRRAAAMDGGSDWAWCGLGVLTALRGDSAAAIPLLERALALNPANPDARSALGILRGSP